MVREREKEIKCLSLVWLFLIIKKNIQNKFKATVKGKELTTKAGNTVNEWRDGKTIKWK